MDLSFLDKSSSVTPLLVRLYDSQKLYKLAKDKKPLARAELTTAVTDLLQMELSPRESELIADVLIELIRQAEQDLKEALSERLSVLDNVPLRLVLQIANDEIEVAAPVLKNSSVLGDLDLIYIIKSKTPEYWQAIAERKAMSDQVLNILADTRDFETAVTLAENENITLTEHALGILADIAQGSDKLAQPLLRRNEVTEELARSLYEFVGQALKQYITENYPVESAAANEAVDEIVLDFVEEKQATEFTPSAQMLKAADRYKDKGLLTVKLMLGTLRRGQIAAFIAQFSGFTGLPSQTIEELLQQTSGQGLAVACRAFEIDKPDFVSIYLLTNRVRNDVSMVDVKDMNRAVQYYDRIKPGVARDIIKNSSGSITGDNNN